MQEIVAKRTANTKHFDLDGGKSRCLAYVSDIHYRDANGQWQDIDLTPTDKGAYFENTTACYQVQVSKTAVEVTYVSSTGHTARLTLASAGAATAFNLQPVVQGNRVLYADIVPGCDVYLHLYPCGVEWFKVLKDSTAPTQFVWDCEYDDGSLMGINTRHAGHDQKNRKAQLTNTTTAKTAPTGKIACTITEAFTGKVSEITDPKTRQRTWVSPAAYPVVIDLNVTEGVTSGAADGYWNNAASTLNRTHTKITAGADHTFTVFHLDLFTLFSGLGIPQGATINSAIAKGFVTHAAAAHLVARGQNVDNATDVFTGSQFPTLPRTTASAAVTGLTATGTQSFDIAAVLQEVIDRTGWASGNNFQMFLSNAAGNTTKMVFAAYENTAHKVAGATAGGFVLQVDYYPPGTLAATESESLPLSDAASVTVVEIATAAEALGLSDTASATEAGRTGAVAETLGLSDTASAAAIENATSTEALALSDAASATGAEVAIGTEALAFSDAASAAGIEMATGAEALTFSDAGSAAVILDVAESLTFSDAELATENAVAASTGALALSDTSTAIVVLGVTEALGLSDVSSATEAEIGTAAETIGLSDAASAEAAFVVSSAESVSFADGAAADVGFRASTVENAPLVAAQEAQLAAASSAAEAAPLADVGDAALVAPGALQEQFLAHDAPSAAATIVADTSESTGLSDSAAGAEIAEEKFRNVLNVLDQQDAIILATASALETLAVAESASGAARRRATVDEGISPADATNYNGTLLAFEDEQMQFDDGQDIVHRYSDATVGGQGRQRSIAGGASRQVGQQSTVSRVVAGGTLRVASAPETSRTV